MSAETEVEIDGYSDNAMEPKASADGKVLFWNNKPATGDWYVVGWWLSKRTLLTPPMPWPARGPPQVDEDGGLRVPSFDE